MSYSHEERKLFKAYPEVQYHEIAIVDSKPVKLITGNVAQHQALAEYPHEILAEVFIYSRIPDEGVLACETLQGSDKAALKGKARELIGKLMESYRMSAEELEAQNTSGVETMPLDEAVKLGS